MFRYLFCVRSVNNIEITAHMYVLFKLGKIDNGRAV